MSTSTESRGRLSPAQVKKVELFCQRYAKWIHFLAKDNYLVRNFKHEFHVFGYLDHSRTLMSSEGSKLEQIGTKKSDLSALLIEGIHASRSQN